MSLRYKNQPVDLKDVLARIEFEKAGARLSVGEAAALVASRTMDRSRNARQEKNLRRMQIRRALEAGNSDPKDRENDTGLVGEPDGRIAVDELVKWATVKYGQHFDDLPRKPRALNMGFEEGIGFNGAMDGIALPGSLDRALAELIRQHAEIQRLMKNAASAEDRRKQELGARFKRK